MPHVALSVKHYLPIIMRDWYQTLEIANPLNGLAPGSVRDLGAVTLTPLAVAPTIGAQPQNQRVQAGSSARFTVSAAGTAPLNYQWAKDGAPLPGPHSNQFAVAQATWVDQGWYSVVVGNAAGSVTSAPARLDVRTNAWPEIASEPQDAVAMAGGTAALEVVALGQSPLHYQWYHAGIAQPGPDAGLYQLAPVTHADAGYYQVVVSNAFGVAVSRLALIQVRDPAGTAPLLLLLLP